MRIIKIINKLVTIKIIEQNRIKNISKNWPFNSIYSINFLQHFNKTKCGAGCLQSTFHSLYSQTYALCQIKLLPLFVVTD